MSKNVVLRVATALKPIQGKKPSVVADLEETFWSWTGHGKLSSDRSGRKEEPMLTALRYIN